MILLSGNVSPAAGGVERSVAAMARALEDSGRRTEYLEIHPGTAPEGMTVLPARVPWARGVLVPLNPGRLRRAVARALRGRVGDLEQIWARSALVAAVAAEVVPDVPLAYIPPGAASEILPFDRVHRGGGLRGALRSAYWRSVGEPREYAAERRAVERADAVVVFSENLRLWLERDYGRKVGARVRVVPPGVDLERFRPARPGEADPPELAGLGRPRVAWIGRMEERKGALLALEALVALPDAFGVFVGSGPQEAEVRAALSARGLAGRVRVLGHVAEPERLYRACDVFAMSSLVEPFGHVMVEALASGLPVVGFSRRSGARAAAEDVVDDGVTGFLVHEAGSAALAAGLGAALDARVADPEIAARCRREAETYRWGDFVRGVQDALLEGTAP